MAEQAATQNISTEYSINSIAPHDFAPPVNSTPHAPADATLDDDTTVWGPDAPILFAGRAPHPRTDVPLPDNDAQLGPSPAGPHQRQPDPLRDSPQQRVPANPDTQTRQCSFHIPTLSRPEPGTDRAVALARECCAVARSTRQRLDPCKPLLQVSQSSASCDVLEQTFGWLADSLSSERPRVTHICAPAGLCAQEAWHAKHAEKVEQLARRCEAFLVDFNPPPTPLTTRDLANQLARHVETLADTNRRIERSWIKLDWEVTSARIEAHSHEIDLLRARRQYLRAQFDATSRRL
ncbi:hypothetical protein DFH07DRAFT_828298 [Mycena maculata]|uniref:Uncharacterized protein n=1 Tax=Mycena maculata TaxID=230809 RepID=A0AAD7ITC0_9AGAR|nr:hypothetical protein DFH07DRAFT_828298 [Mycena maculata]